jgi:hypothetical protein
MAFLGLRWRRLPTRRRPPFEPGEHLLAFTDLAGDQVIVVTNRGLWPPAETWSRDDRIDWHEIHKVAWSGSALTVIPAVATATIGEADDERYHVMADAAALTYQLSDPDQVPEQVRNRVNHSVAHTTHHTLPGETGGVRVVARRVSGVNGLRWTARFDPGTDETDPGVLAETTALVRRAMARPAVT